MDFDFKMKLTGIGPHFNTELSSRVSSINMALYADNGSGKSFISKSFKRVTDLKYLDTTDPDKVSALIEKSSAMVRFGEKQGTLSLSIKPDSEPQKELSVKFSADSLPEIADNTGLIYHVFNSEYVRENLEAVKSYIYIKVKLLFDPPTSSAVMEAMNRIASEYEWRLNVEAESAPVIVGEDGDQNE